MSPDPSSAIAGGIFGAMILLYVGAIILGILLSVFWIIEIIDVARREFVDPNMKVVWLLVVILVHTLGAIIYYFVGKKQGWLPSETPMVSRPTARYDSSGTWPPPPGNY
jgi:hypothetical protein